MSCPVITVVVFHPQTPYNYNTFDSFLLGPLPPLDGGCCSLLKPMQRYIFACPVFWMHARALACVCVCVRQSELTSPFFSLSFLSAQPHHPHLRREEQQGRPPRGCSLVLVAPEPGDGERVRPAHRLPQGLSAAEIPKKIIKVLPSDDKREPSW